MFILLIQLTKRALESKKTLKSALNSSGKGVLEGHIPHCVHIGIGHGESEKTIESFTKAVERFFNIQ